jgi:plastocyanin
MLKVTTILTFSGTIVLCACSEPTAPAAAGPESALNAQAAVDNGDPGRRFFLRDRCGGDSWAPLGGCAIDGSVTLQEFVTRVGATGSHPLWANSPVATSVQTGTSLEIVNVGGRDHTFTRVTNFGGGLVPSLNTRPDTQVPAPECFAGIVVIAGGGASVDHTFMGTGEQRYQCCFHPWMRTTVRVTAAHH